MTSWRDSITEFGERPEIGSLLLFGPALVWSRDGSRVLFANPAGGRLLGVQGFAALWRWQWPVAAPLRRMIESLGQLGESGGPARLRFPGDAAMMARECDCRPLRTADHAGMLITTADAAMAPAGPADVAAFYSDEEFAAVVLDEGGAVLAGELPPAGDGQPTPGGFAFDGAGRRLRLVFACRAPTVEARARSAGGPAAAAAAGQAPRAAARLEEEERLRRELERLALEAPEPVNSIGPAEAAPPPPPGDGKPADERPPAKPPEVMLRRAPPRAAAAAEQRPGRKVMAGRVPRELGRAPVRFLWQTDASERFLFVSPGLAQVVGRNAEVVGESWQDAARRLHLDPARRIAAALARRDTWSGLTAWWPVEGSNVRVPAEITALPIYGGDHTFQGYRGFGVLKPAEALMPAAFQARFGTVEAAAGRPTEQAVEQGAEPATTGNIVPIRADIEAGATQSRLSDQERSAFEEIAAALRGRVAAEPEFRTESDEPDDRVGAGSPRPAAGPAPPAPAKEQSATAVQGRAQTARAEAAEGEAQRRLREMAAILDTATDGVLILDAEGVIESASASAQALFGREDDELRGASFGDLLTTESRIAALDYLAGLKGSGVTSLLNEGKEIEARAGEGAIPLFMTMGRISGPEGGRFCAVLRDITHWKRTEADLVAARRAAEAASSQKSDFLARVSHEIRTPLNAIIGFAEVMIEERFGAIQNERYREYLRDIRTSGEHVVSLINDLLDISKVEAGKLDMNFVAVPLNDLVRESIGLMQPQANRGHVVLRSSLSRDVPGVVADQKTLRQVILNLLSNSVKFTPPGGQVIASTSLAESGEALLRVRDTGAGMSEDELARALEPFRQLTTASLADRSGTGLGLPLTKALVEANRASFAIKSARGEGTVVTVTFPPTRVLSE
jgi:PAS domain S-box-containing protein